MNMKHISNYNEYDKTNDLNEKISLKSLLNAAVIFLGTCSIVHTLTTKNIENDITGTVTSSEVKDKHVYVDFKNEKGDEQSVILPDTFRINTFIKTGDKIRLEYKNGDNKYDFYLIK